MVEKIKQNIIAGTEYGTQGPEYGVFKKIGLGTASGLLKIPEAILELGAGFSDYAFNTELVKALEEHYPRINVDDGVGKFVEIIVQYGIPYTAALKIGSKVMGLKRLREASQAGKTMGSRVAAKMGYYGLPALATEPLFGAARDRTLGEAFGLYDSYEVDREGKTGRELGASVLKQKLLTGIEGGALAGLISTAAGPAIAAGAKGTSIVASGVGKAASATIINPVANLIGKETTGKITRKTLETVKYLKDKVDPLSLQQLKMVDSDQITLLQRIKSVFGKYLTPEGNMTREHFTDFMQTPDTIKAIRGDLNLFLPRMVKETEKVSKVLSKSFGDETLTRQQALLKEISRTLTRATVGKGDKLPTEETVKEALKSFRKQFKDSGVSKTDLDDLVGAVENLAVFGKGLSDKVLKTFRPATNPKASKSIKADLNEEITNLVQGRIDNYYRAFDKSSKFRFRGKEFEANRSVAIREAAKVIKNNRKKGEKVLTDAQARGMATRQINMLVNRAEKAGGEGAFFTQIKDLKAVGAERYFTSLEKEMIKKREFSTAGDYNLALKNLLGYETNAPLRAFENKYMGLASQLGQKRFINAAVARDAALGPVVAGRGAKILFKPTGKSREQMLKEGLAEETVDYEIRENVKNQIAQEYGIDPKLMGDTTVVPINPKSTAAKIAEDPFGIYDAIAPIAVRAGGEGAQYFTTRLIHESLLGMKNWTDTLLNLPLYKGFLMGKAGTQIGKTILSPVTQIRNFTSAAFFALHNGHFGNPFGLSKGKFTLTDVLKTHIDELFPDGKVTNEGLRKLAKDAARKNELGVTTGSIVQQEIDDLIIDVTKKGWKYETTEQLFDKIFKSKSYQNIIGEPLVGSAKQMYGKLQQFYTKGDDFWKDYGYRYTKSQLGQAFGSIKKDEAASKAIQNAYYQIFGRRINPSRLADGKLAPKTREELLEEFSAEYIKNTYPNYTYVPESIKILRRLPFGNFISFPAEILRTSGNLVKLTGKELAINTGDKTVDSVIRQMGTRRLIGQMTGFATGPILASYSKEMLGISDDQYDRLRETEVPEWNKYSDLIMLGKKREADGNVKYRYMNWAYQNPYDYIRAPVYGALGAWSAGEKIGKDWDEKFLDASFRAMKSMFSPFIDEAILSEKLIDVTLRKGHTKEGRELFNSGVDSVGDRLAAGFAHIVQGVSPGALTQVANVSSAIAGETTPYGKQYQLGDELLALLSGIRVYESDIKNNLNFAVNGYLRDNATHKKRAGALIFASNVTPGTISEAYREYLDGSYRSYNKIRKHLDDAIALGMSPQDVRKYLKQRKVRKDIRQTIQRRKFVPPKWRTFYNDQRFKNVAKERGIPRNQLFPTNEMRRIRNEYKNMDLFQSLSDIRGIIQDKRERYAARIEQRMAQGPGTTANVPPVASAQVPATPPVGTQETGIQGLTPTQDYVLTDPDMRTIAAKRNQRQTVV